MNRHSLKKILITYSEYNRLEYEKGGGQISLISNNKITLNKIMTLTINDKRYQKISYLNIKIRHIIIPNIIGYMNIADGKIPDIKTMRKQETTLYEDRMNIIIIRK